MANALLCPGANHTSQWFAKDYPGTIFTTLGKLLLHTTEGSGWPGYAGGSTAPNLTGYPDPAARTVLWRQHFPVNMSSRARMHTRTQPTNGDHVLQVELVGTCVPGGPGLYWPGARDWALRCVADLLAWLHAEWMVPISTGVLWRAYDAPGDGQRLTDAGYNAYRGVLGHQHAPQNSHRDPGALDVARIVRLAGGGGSDGMAPTLQEIQSGLLYYDLGSDYVNPLTLIKRTYDSVNVLLAGSADEAVALAAIRAVLAGQADAVAARVLALLPHGVLTSAEVETAVREALGEGSV